MPRIRTLKPEALQHRKVGRLSDGAFRLWVALITQADDEGRLVFDAHQFRVLVWGYHLDRSAHDVDNSLEEIVKLGLCRIYAEGDCQYVDLPSWRDHQKVDHPRPSILPRFEGNAHNSPSPREASRDFARLRGGSEGSEGSEGSDLPRANARRGGEPPPSAPGGRAAAPPRVDNSESGGPPGPLAGTIHEFMTTLRRAAEAPPGSLPPRGGEAAEV